MQAPAQPEFEFDVFLSYSRADEAMVRRLQDALLAVGFSVWRDKGEISGGSDFLSRIEDGLRKSRAVLIFCSATASASEWVETEWHSARVLKTQIIPIRLDDSEVPLLLKTLSLIDLRNPERFDEAVSAVMDALSGTLAQRSSHVDVPTASAPVTALPSVLRLELESLNRMINREEQFVEKLKRTRNKVAVAGLLFAVALTIVAAASLSPQWAISSGCGCTLLTAGLMLAFASQSRSRRAKCGVLSALREGIQVYCPAQPSCVAFRQRFEHLLRETAQIGGTANGR
jgi:hypothetical protein